MALCKEGQQELHLGSVLCPLVKALVSFGFCTALSMTDKVFMCHSDLEIHSK